MGYSKKKKYRRIRRSYRRGKRGGEKWGGGEEVKEEEEKEKWEWEGRRRKRRRGRQVVPGMTLKYITPFFSTSLVMSTNSWSR